MKPGIAYILFIVLSLSGCAAIENNPNTAGLVVKYATLKVIYEADDPIKKAVEVESIAQAALLYVSGEPVAIPELRAYVESEINWSELDPADTLLARHLIESIATYLEEMEAGNGPLEGESLVTAIQVFTWVIEATRSQ
jgi:hypothetical protein